MTDILTQQNLYDLFRNKVQSVAPGLTDFEEGSNLDAFGGGVSVAGQEIVTFIVSEFSKTFFNTANGSAVTGNIDDLEALAVDHFGANFRRPGAANALATVQFSRPNLDNGLTVIEAGTIVKTDTDSSGNEERFRVVSEVTMQGLSINASVEAIEGGSDSNVGSGTITNIETSLTDPTIVVTNILPATGGAPALDDSQYREFIRQQVETLRGATQAAIEAASVNVPGVEIATLIENVQRVIAYDDATQAPLVGSAPFSITRAVLYIADANGTATQALIEQVREAISSVRACGVVKEILGATPLNLDWRASISLSPSGPNFAVFNSNTTLITESMEQYIRDLPIGTGFDRSLARQAILAIWGPSGSGDLTDFIINQPTGNVTSQQTEKLIPGIVEII